MPIVVNGFYSLKHAAQKLGITQADLRELIAVERIPAIEIDGVLLLTAVDVEHWLKDKRND